jgi:DNA-binding NarL/FixJ family response regulator
MKKLLIARELHVLLEQNETFLKRTDLAVFVAATNDEALHIHRVERVSLIITQIDLPGMPSEQFCSIIRENEDLRAVSMILVCADTPNEIDRSAQCRANAVLLHPVHPFVLMVKAQQLLDIAAREMLRVLLSANVVGRVEDEPFLCRVRNISVSGMLIECDTPLAKDARLDCMFYLPNAKKVELSGKIVRSLEQSPEHEVYQYGLMFIDITAGAKRLLADYIEQASRTSYPGSPLSG